MGIEASGGGIVTGLPRHAFFVLVRALPAWLRLSREKRTQIRFNEIGPLLEQYPQVAARSFDAEAYHARSSDVFMFETADLRAYYFLIEALRDGSIFSVPFFEVVEIIPAIENGFRQYERDGAES